MDYCPSNHIQLQNMTKNTRTFEELYTLGTNGEDNLKSLISLFSANDNLLKGVIFTFLESLIDTYIALEADMDSMDLLEELASLAPETFEKAVRGRLMVMNAQSEAKSLQDFEQDSFDWFLKNHSLIATDHRAEVNQLENNLNSQASKEKMEALRKRFLDDK